MPPENTLLGIGWMLVPLEDGDISKQKMIMPSDLPMDCRKILSRWSGQEYYVYLRPLTSKLVDASKKHTTYWVVSVEYRAMPPGHWRAEGYSLAEVIRELDQTVPRRRGGHRIDQRRQPGLNAPAKAQKRAQRLAREDRETQKPKRRKKVRE